MRVVKLVGSGSFIDVVAYGEVVSADVLQEGYVYLDLDDVYCVGGDHFGGAWVSAETGMLRAVTQSGDAQCDLLRVVPEDLGYLASCAAD